MNTGISEKILELVAAGQAAAACGQILSLDADDDMLEVLEKVWHALGEPRFAEMPVPRDQVREAVRAWLQDCDMQLARHMAGAARCPFCIKMCEFQACEVCEHHVGVDSYELEVQEMCRECEDSIQELGGVISDVDSGDLPELSDWPDDILPEPWIKQQPSDAHESLRLLLKAFGCVWIDTMFQNGDRCDLVFAADPDVVYGRLTETVDGLVEWADEQREEQDDDD